MPANGQAVVQPIYCHAWTLAPMYFSGAACCPGIKDISAGLELNVGTNPSDLLQESVSLSTTSYPLIEQHEHEAYWR